MAEVAVRAAQAADEEIELAAVVEVGPHGARGVAGERGERAGLRGDVGEAALAVVAEKFAPAGLRHEHVGRFVAIEVAEDRRDLPGAKREAGVLRLGETLLLVQHEHAAARAVEKVGAPVAIDIGEREAVAFQPRREAVAPEPDFVGDILELRRGGGAHIQQ